MKNPSQGALVALVASLSVAGCATYGQEKPATQDEPSPEVASACPILKSSDWAATITPTPSDPTRRTLTVTGTVTTPTPGYTFSWQPGRLDRSAVPAFQLMISGVAPDGLVMQALDTKNVTFIGPAIVRLQ